MSPVHTLRKNSRVFFGIILLLVVCGFFIFVSASLGKIDQDISSFVRLVTKQLVVLFVGFILMLVISQIPYKKWRQYALLMLIVTTIGTLLVFVPGLGIKAGGAYRWIGFGGFTIQPSEFLKLGLIVYFAAWISSVKTKVSDTKWGLLPLLILLGGAGAIFFLQPDIGTFLIIAVSLVAIYFVGGASLKDLGILFLIGLIAAGGLVASKPYLRQRVMTFINPDANVLSSSYQINQSLIAVGSGGMFGRGFGQSLQKFNFLPQPVGDSIYAVASEEFGFLGSVFLLSLFLLFGLWGLKIAGGAPDTFGRLLVVGIVILVMTQSFMNIGSMLGIIPLTGDPLAFVSQGGSALLFALMGSGIILNISRTTT
jgi:cell division protein FtsW